jgi:hypothetical protein
MSYSFDVFKVACSYQRELKTNIKARLGALACF